MQNQIVNKGEWVKIVAVSSHQSKDWIGRQGVVEHQSRRRVNVRLNKLDGSGPEPFVLEMECDHIQRIDAASGINQEFEITACFQHEGSIGTILDFNPNDGNYLVDWSHGTQLWHPVEMVNKWKHINPPHAEVGDQVLLRLQVCGEHRVCIGTVTGTIGDQGILIDYQCQLPPRDNLAEIYHASYPDDGIHRAQVQCQRSLVRRVLKNASNGFKPGFQEVALSEIEVDIKGIQPRVDFSLVRRKIEDYVDLMTNQQWDWQRQHDRMYAFWDGKKLWLSSGFSRLESARCAGLKTIWLDVRFGDHDDAVLEAPGGNSSHGVPMTREDKRRAITLILGCEKFRKLSDREIATLLTERGIYTTHKTVGSVRSSLETSGEIPQTPERTVTRGGTTYQLTPHKPVERSFDELKTLYEGLGGTFTRSIGKRPFVYETNGLFKTFSSTNEAYELFPNVRDVLDVRQSQHTRTNRCDSCQHYEVLKDSDSDLFRCGARATTFGLMENPALGCSLFKLNNKQQQSGEAVATLPLQEQVAMGDGSPQEARQTIEQVGQEMLNPQQELDDFVENLIFTYGLKALVIAAISKCEVTEVEGLISFIRDFVDEQHSNYSYKPGVSGDHRESGIPEAKLSRLRS